MLSVPRFQECQKSSEQKGGMLVQVAARPVQDISVLISDAPRNLLCFSDVFLAPLAPLGLLGQK